MTDRDAGASMPPHPRPTHPIDWLRRPRRRLMTDRPTGPPNPFEACMFAACAVIGAVTAAGYARLGAFQGSLPGWGQTVWGVLMFVGGVAAAAGLYWPGDPVDGVVIKRVGMVTVGPLAVAYGLAGIITDPRARFAASVFAIAVGVACAWRTRQVTKAIAGLHHQLRGLREEWRNGGIP